MANLPLNLQIPQMQKQWSALLNPVIAAPLINGLQINNIALKSGANILNHTLQRVMQGWFLVDIQGVASIYRPATAPFNKLTLTLIASADVTVNLWVY